MNSSRIGGRGGFALLGAALFVSMGFTSSAIAIEPTPAQGPILLAQAAPMKVSYSKDQAKRGEARFKESCVDCHGEDLRGGLNGGPPLRGNMFNEHFAGSPANALFLFMSTQMPPEAPGRFSDSVYADLMAYVLQVNGYDDGAPLPSNADTLANLVLEK